MYRNGFGYFVSRVEEKHENVFDRSDMYFVAGQYDDSNQDDVNKLYGYLNEIEGNNVQPYTGSITVVNGTAVSDGFTP